MLGLTVQQAAVIAIVCGMLIMFMWERWRYDVVAVSALCAAIAVGVVPADKAFIGFSDQVIVVIASVLVVSKAIARSGLLDRLARRSMKGIGSASLQVGVLSAAVGLMSALVKNVGTLGIFMPIAIQVARRCKRQPSIYLMPLAFASLIGGTITQIGTSPNLLISTVRQDLGGAPFRLFDYAWVGLPLTILAVAYLMVGWRLLPRDRTAAPSPEDAFSISDYVTELVLKEDSPFVGKTVGDLEKAGDGEVVITALERAGRHIQVPTVHWPLMTGDILTLQAEPHVVKTLVDEMKLELLHARELKADAEGAELRPVEAVVGSDSPLLGRTPIEHDLRQRFDINLLAVSRAGTRRATRLQSHRFQVGDVVVIQGSESTLQGTLTELGLIPLADRGLTIGSRVSGLIPLAVLAVAMVLISFKATTVAVGFFAAAVAVVLLRQIPVKEAYQAIEGPVIVMLAALIPIAQSFQTTGVTDILGNGIASATAALPGWAAVTVMLAVAMILTPFLNNAAAVLMLGPVAGTVAKHLGNSPDPFLMAVALGCACDFLTPVGHQNNLLVMGPGGYRFGDYWRLGLPLSLLVLCAGPALILWAWPLR